MEAKDKIIIVRASAKEKALLAKAAEDRGQKLSAWLRMIALEAAKKDARK